MDKARATKRIQREMIELSKNPSKHWKVMPVDEDFFEWHFTIRGPSGSDFEDGRYHGRICLPVNYPFAPPSIMLLTPNGRFEVNTKICLSASNYHPELWQPAWGIRTILEALRSFFPTPAEGALGSLDWPARVRKQIAKEETGKWHCSVCNATNDEILPLLPLDEEEEEEAGSSMVPILGQVAEVANGAGNGNASIEGSADAPAVPDPATVPTTTTTASIPAPTPAVIPAPTTSTTASLPPATTATASILVPTASIPPAPTGTTTTTTTTTTPPPSTAPALVQAASPSPLRPNNEMLTSQTGSTTNITSQEPASSSAGGLGINQPSASSSSADNGGVAQKKEDENSTSTDSRRRQPRVDRPIFAQLLPTKPQDKREATLYIIDILLLFTASLIGYFAYDIVKKPFF